MFNYSQISKQIKLGVIVVIVIIGYIVGLYNVTFTFGPWLSIKFDFWFFVLKTLGTYEVMCLSQEPNGHILTSHTGCFAKTKHLKHAGK